MKKILFFIISLPFLYGCTFSPTAQQQQRGLGDEEYKEKNGKVWTVNKIREDYTKKTGMILIAPDTKSCGWNSTCYQNAWAEAYDKGIYEFNAKKEADAKIAESQCQSDPDCIRKKNLALAMKELSWNYTMLLGTNQYAQADYDYIIRNVCDSAASAQRNGSRKEVVVNKMKDLPGISPRDRSYLSGAVKSCWEISSLSGDWKEALRR